MWGVGVAIGWDGERSDEERSGEEWSRAEKSGAERSGASLTILSNRVCNMTKPV